MIAAIETTGSSCSVALYQRSERKEERSYRVVGFVKSGLPNVHDRLLADMFRSVHDFALSSPEELESVAVAVGPGSFTGIRIGISFSIGVAIGLGIPLVPVSVLDAIAWRTRRFSGVSGKSRTLSLISDQRGDLYAALYNVAPRFQRLTAPYNVAPRDVPEMLDENMIAAGPGTRLLQDIDGDSYPSPGIDVDALLVGAYGTELFQKGLCVEAHQIQPLYVGKTYAEK